jgi:hypothetical protein
MAQAWAAAEAKAVAAVAAVADPEADASCATRYAGAYRPPIDIANRLTALRGAGIRSGTMDSTAG